MKIEDVKSTTFELVAAVAIDTLRETSLSQHWQDSLNATDITDQMTSREKGGGLGVGGAGVGSLENSSRGNGG